MGASDGSVGSTTKIVDHGAPTARWNLVIVGDGYRPSEIPQYHADVQNIIDRLRTTPPFDELWCGINVYRIDVTSTDSGADDPTVCPDGAGTGAVAATYFDATFCSTGPGGVKLSRLLTIDSGLAQSVAVARVPEMHQVLAVVNSSKYGGSGGSVATCSTNVQAAEIAIHEMGHSAFGLADEYGGNGTGTPAGEPPKPNVTRDTNRATNKWRDLIAATTPMPSACDASCTTSTCVPPATPPAAGAVGTYEGGMYSDCNVYRPLPSCYMRDYAAFCPVCARVIRQTLATYLPAESIAPLTASIEFTNIPEGLGGTGITTFRAITFEIVTCRRLTFRFTAGPTGGFGTPLGTSVITDAAEIGPVARVHLWLSYTSTTAGATSSGSVTVQCDETGQTWVIGIHANTVARPKSSVVLVLDHSGSMSEDAGDGIVKVSKLREACTVFIDAMLEGDGVGIVRFDDTAERLMDVTNVGPLSTGAGRVAAIGHINSSEVDPDGATSIGAGVQQGRNALDDAQAAATPHYDVQAMVVLTDGVENTAPLIASVSSSVTANTFAIGLGLPSNISVGALDALTQGHDGYLVVTGKLTTDQRYYLTKYFLQVLAGVTNANVIVDPHGALPFGAEHRIPFMVSEADYGIDVFLLCQAPQYVDFALETPSGDRIDSAALGPLGTTEFVSRGTASFYRASLPAIPANGGGSHAGVWYALLRIGGKRTAWSRDTLAAAAASSQGVLPYDILVHCYSNLLLDVRAVQSGYEPGASVQIVASLREYDVPVEGRTRVWAEVTRPNGTRFDLALDEEPGGQFSGVYAAMIAGLYQARVRARGETFYGAPFTREQTVSVVVTPGGNTGPAIQPRDTIGELMCCLLKSGALDDPALKRLLGSRANVDALLRCLKRLCADRGSPNEGKTRSKGRDLIQRADIETALTVLRQLAQQRLGSDGE